MASPTCTVTGSSSGGPFATTNGRNMTAGETVTIALSSTAGVTTWSITVAGTDEVTAAPTLTVNSVTKTATFTMPAAGTGVGLVFQSQVNGGLTNGVTDPTQTATFALFVLNSSGWRVGAYNMTLEPNSSTGWVGIMNQPIRSAASGGSLAGDVTGTLGANTVVQLTGTANVVAIPTNTVLQWASSGPSIGTRDAGLGLNLRVATTNNSIALVDGSTTWAFFNYNTGSPFFQALGLPMQFQTTGANSLRMAATGTGELDLDGTIVKIRSASGAATVFQANATGLGVFGVTPIARVSAYTVTNHTARRAIDETAITLAQLANVVGTMIIDLQNYGWFQ